VRRPHGPCRRGSSLAARPPVDPTTVAGRTVASPRLPGLLPPLEHPAALEVTAIHSVAGRLGGSAHHRAAVRGGAPQGHRRRTGGRWLGCAAGGPGLARVPWGALLDEAPALDAAALEALGQPLESGQPAM